MSQPQYKIKSVVLHASVEFPGLEAGVSINSTRYPGVQLTEDGTFLRVAYKNNLGLIPLTNVKFIVMEPVE